jgi:hypothetical protein
MKLRNYLELCKEIFTETIKFKKLQILFEWSLDDRCQTNFVTLQSNKWMIIVQRQVSNFSATGISWREQDTFWWGEGDIRFVLDQQA